MLSPTRMSPSTAAAGSAEGSITHVNPSTGGPLTYPPSSAVLGLAFLTFPTAWPGSAFVPPSTASPGLAYAGTNAQVFFRAEIMPGNAFVHPHFTLGPSVAAAPANCRLEPEPEPATMLAEPSRRLLSCHFSRLPLSWLTV